jgi:phosphate transport system substrate-binding protein
MGTDASHRPGGSLNVLGRVVRGSDVLSAPGRRVARWALLTAIVLASCARVETPKITPITVHLRLAADTAALTLMQALADAYSSQHPEVQFSVQSGNAETVADAIFSRQADLATVSVLPQQVRGRDIPWIADLALDGVAIVVNPANPVDSLSLQELRDIYSGVHNRWDDFGVAELGDIEAAVREEGDGTRTTFDNVVMGNTRLTLSAIVLPSVDVAMNFTAIQANAIAYVPSARITSTVSPAVKVVNVDGQPPTRESIANGTYRLSRMLNLMALEEPQGELRKFVTWILSREGQAVVASMNYVEVGQASR